MTVYSSIENLYQTNQEEFIKLHKAVIEKETNTINKYYQNATIEDYEIAINVNTIDDLRKHSQEGAALYQDYLKKVSDNDYPPTPLGVLSGIFIQGLKQNNQINNEMLYYLLSPIISYDSIMFDWSEGFLSNNFTRRNFDGYTTREQMRRVLSSANPVHPLTRKILNNNEKNFVNCDILYEDKMQKIINLLKIQPQANFYKTLTEGHLKMPKILIPFSVCLKLTYHKNLHLGILLLFAPVFTWSLFYIVPLFILLMAIVQYIKTNEEMRINDELRYENDNEAARLNNADIDEVLEDLQQDNPGWQIRWLNEAPNNAALLPR